MQGRAVSCPLKHGGLPSSRCLPNGCGFGPRVCTVSDRVHSHCASRNHRILIQKGTDYRWKDSTDLDESFDGFCHLGC